VVEKKERVDQATVFAFNLLDKTMETIKPENIIFIYNKAVPEEDDFESC
jgi:hypothetical protein